MDKPKCSLCGSPIKDVQFFWSAGLAYHFFDCPKDLEGTPESTPTPPKPLTEEDVRRIVREEIADTIRTGQLWRQQAERGKL